MLVDAMVRELLDGCRSEAFSSGSMQCPFSVFDILIQHADISRSTATSPIFFARRGPLSNTVRNFLE